MKILNIEGLTLFEIKQLILQGGKFVSFSYTASAFPKKFNRTSNTYFVRPGESSFKYSMRFLILNLRAGWWGLPLKPLYTIKALFYHIIGGKDVTLTVLAELYNNNPVYSPNIHYLKWELTW
ncbi:hypothetical protein GKZ90_0014890 [Flavobacterium sp. MC2016-06]|uniref:hypothetical protein n=1 Tax=Flavobacterium sp. MC2016-06 TaxID=2676308 RepID=UPI0012BA5CDE|nr:hypothetical protein [Flavobacterium sp. MC2016-06]MBU3859307.1 hypothetical protein [Flavobacterium sp. MC2016-06]